MIRRVDPEGGRTAYLENPEPHFRTYWPKTRREFLMLQGEH